MVQKISPLLTKYFYSTKFNKHVKTVQQPELKLHDGIKVVKQKICNVSFIDSSGTPHHSMCSKCFHLAFKHALRQTRHWSVA